MASREIDIVLGPTGWQLLDGQVYPGVRVATIIVHDIEVEKPKDPNVIYQCTPRQVADGLVGGHFIVSRAAAEPTPRVVPPEVLQEVKPKVKRKSRETVKKELVDE